VLQTALKHLSIFLRRTLNSCWASKESIHLGVVLQVERNDYLRSQNGVEVFCVHASQVDSRSLHTLRRQQPPRRIHCLLHSVQTQNRHSQEAAARADMIVGKPCKASHDESLHWILATPNQQRRKRLLAAYIGCSHQLGPLHVNRNTCKQQVLFQSCSCLISSGTDSTAA
jgi:hypothetical protein